MITKGKSAGSAVVLISMTAALLVTSALTQPVAAQARLDRSAHGVGADTLESAFRDPPTAARPLVWWHWLNGNVSKDGIRKDLEWMKRSGVAGFQLFDADIDTPRIVNHRLVFMTPEWKQAVRFAASEAERLDLEMAVAASPGFSVTGGPWVEPKDGMKKIVWSETIVQGGRPFRGALAKPPGTAGPFQDAPHKDLLAPLIGEMKAPSLYQDTAVFAYRVPAGSQPLAVTASLAGKPLDAALLSDGSFARGVTVPKGSASAPAIVELTLDKAQPVQAVTLSMNGAFQLFKPGIVFSRLEASTDGATWRKVVDLGVNLLPTTTSFAPVEAKFFRLVMNYHATLGGGDPNAAAGVAPSPFKAFESSPSVELLELRLSTEARIDRWEAKAGFSTLPPRYSPDPGLDAREAGVAADDVIDLTGRLGPDGVLDWTPPSGAWRVVRMGWSLLGTTNHPATAEATGLEVDKLDRSAVRRYIETYLTKYRDAAGADLFGKRGVQALLTDSTEVGMFNWSPRLLEEFHRLRGYDPRPWLPTLTGAVVGSRERSDGFLFDFRRTIGDLHASEHYGTIAAVAHEHGLKVYGESLEGSAGSPGDDLDMRRYADIPMGAQWSYSRDGKPEPTNEADIRGAASVAHFYGKAIVAAESLTSASTPWGMAPADLRRVIDLEFASGVNRPVIHTSPHVPRDDKQPGLSLWIYGQYFNRAETWAEMARPWIDYIARSSMLLQAGRPVADVAYFYGEASPIGALSAQGLPSDLPKRNAYDFVSANAVRNDLTVDRGDLVSPGGARYRLLYLGGSSDRITLPMLRRIATLAEQGATIVGQAPKGSPGLEARGPEYAELIARLWPGGEMTRVGQGRIIAGRDVEKALGLIDAAPDLALAEVRPESPILFVHRKIEGGDVYFVNNRGKQAMEAEASFRVSGKSPEIWRADTASIKPASYRFENGRTVVPLHLAAEESYFVVFRRAAAVPNRSIAPETFTTVAQLQGPWAVSFQPGRGAPASASLAELGSLAEQPQPGIRYFSGVATYRKTIDAPRAHVPGKPLLLDLGAIGDVAEVWVNGRLAGTAWQAPYRIDVGRFMERGRNRLDIRVANLWVNRLIGDMQPGATRVAYTATPSYTASAPLRPSGLLGPVRLLTINQSQ